MPKRLLLLDDDKDFTGLLNDVFKQGNYDIRIENDPLRALALLRAEPFDLLVTDHRMPGMTGDLLVRELRHTHPALPVIVISGFLDNDAIRSLIRDGVGGIFMKPLNVVNLLRRASMLLDEADQRAGREPEPFAPESASTLPFPFQSYPCVAAKSREFAMQLRAKAGFRGSLTLVCPPGTPLRDILNDFESFTQAQGTKVALITNRNLTADNVLQQLAEIREAGGTPVLAFQNLDFAQSEAKAVVAALGARKGPFARLEAPIPLIFAFTHPVDELYERGKLDEAIYLLASITELRAPSLAECPEDIPGFVHRFLRDYCRTAGLKDDLRINKVAQVWLREQPWPGNVDELHGRIINAAHLPHGGVITRESFDVSQNEQQWPEGPAGVYALHEYMSRLRDDYIQAAMLLCEGDTAIAARSLGVPKAMLDTRTSGTPNRD